MNKDLKQNYFSIDNLSFRFAAEQPLFFEALNFRVPASSLSFIRGRNGVGKSLLFRLISGVVNANEIIMGNISLKDSSYTLSAGLSLPLAYQTQVHVVNQKFDLMLADRFSFIENLKLAQMPRYPGLRTPRIDPVIPEALYSLNIDFNRPVHLLSGGQRQILATTMAIQKPTSVLLLDEPTAALDDQNAQAVMEFLQMLTHTTGLVTIVISHDRELIERFSADYYFELSADQKTGVRTLKKQSLPFLF
ncbi:MAG: ABC transporter ATP binding protein [candidate division TM6 bacterium GW2011_GWE2_42_60]|nr:MAG: ABC transporter ATP binding protein [candidate division TM6 bacterium GW2011_GWE2_42_60]HBY05777.1 hypothetical protein [Candidatus Dependentiae bacterium]